MTFAMDISEFNKNFRVKYFPDSSVRGQNQLVGFTKFKELVADEKIFKGILKDLERFKGDRIERKLRRGISFYFTRR